MGWLVLSIIICIVVGIIAYFAEYEDVESFIFGVFIGALISLFVIAILTVVSLCFTEVVGEEEEIQYNIISLENKDAIKSNIHGSFILGYGGISGSSSSTIKYYFFRSDENGKKLESVDGTDVYIRENNEQEPCYIIKKYIVKNTGIFEWLFGEDEHKVDGTKILVVPENTVKIEYNIDI